MKINYLSKNLDIKVYIPNSIIKLMYRPDSGDEDFKIVRQKQTNQIRKTTREEIFKKRRTIAQVSSPSEQMGMNEQQPRQIKMVIIDASRKQMIQELINANYSMNMFDQLCGNLKSLDVGLMHRGVIGLRKIVSIDKTPPIQQIVDAGIVPLLITLMRQSEYMQLQLEATWVVTNVAAGNTFHCQSIIDKGGLEVLVKILNQNVNGVVEQGIWAIGNIAGDCPRFRDMIIAAGGIQPIVRIIQTCQFKNTVKQACWTLSNLCRGSPLPKYDLVKSAVPALCKSILSDILDNQILEDCCWALSYLSQGTKSKIQRVVESGVVPKLIKICESPFMSMIIPCLRVIGNISTGNQTQTQQILKGGALELLNKLLDHTKKSVRRETCWILSNIAAGTRSQTDTLIQRKDILEKVNKIFSIDDNDVKRQICYIFSNMVHLGNPLNVFQCIKEHYVLEQFSVLIMQDEDVKTLETALDCLSKILEVGNKIKLKKEDKNLVMMHFQSIPNVIERLEQLQYHQSESIYKKVSKLIQKFFTVQSMEID